jgi:chromosome segregation ATPase
MSYASHEEMEMAVEERFEEEINELKGKIDELESRIEGLEDEVQGMENERDKLQGDLHEAQHFIDWVRDAYPNAIDDYNAVMLIQGDGYGIPKHSSV